MLRKTKVILMSILLLCFVFIIFQIILNYNVSSEIKSKMNMQYSQKIYTIEEIKDIYFQPQTRMARSFNLTFERINNFLPVSHINKSKVFNFNTCSFVYYTFFELEEGTLYILFDKRGSEIYSFILNKNPPESGDFNAIEINKSTFEDIQNIDKCAYLFVTVPKIYNINEPLLDVPYSVHITKDHKILKVSYKDQNGKYIVSGVSDFSTELNFNINWFLSDIEK